MAISKSSEGVILEKINNLHSKLDEICCLLKDEIKPEMQLNTDFRLQAKGFFTGMLALSSILGAGIIWLLTKLFD